MHPAPIGDCICFSILPIPPLELFRVVSRIPGVIHRAAHYIQHAAVELAASVDAQFVVKRLRVAPGEVADAADAERPQVFGDGLADTGDGFQLA